MTSPYIYPGSPEWKRFWRGHVWSKADVRRLQRIGAAPLKFNIIPPMPARTTKR